jgi:hypothetical protein
MHTDQDKKFNKRNFERNIQNGIITQKDYRTYSSKLPDMSDKLFSGSEFPDGLRSPVPQTTARNAYRKRNINKDSKTKRK